MYVAWQDDSDTVGSIYVMRFDGAAWILVGSGSLSGGGIVGTPGLFPYARPALVVDALGRPVVAWSEGAEIYIKRFDGMVWGEVGTGSASGGGISSTGGANRPAVAINGANHPIVAWDDFSYSASNHIYIKQFDGDVWQPLGSGAASEFGVSGTSTDSTRPTLVVTAAGSPVLAYSDSALGLPRQVYVKQFDGLAWVEMGVGSATGAGISTPGSASADYPSLAALGEELMVAWSSSTTLGEQEIFLKRFDGTSWVEHGVGSASEHGISANAGVSADPSLTIGPSGQPVVAWSDTALGASEIYLRRLQGGVWLDTNSEVTAKGGVSGTAAASYAPVLNLSASGMPTVAWTDYFLETHAWELDLRSWDGQQWVGLPSGTGVVVVAGEGGPTTTNVALAADVNGLPMIAWTTWQGVYVKRFDGTAWIEVGAGSASGAGASAEVGTCPSLAIGSAGEVVMAWQHDDGGGNQLFAKRFDGVMWSDVGVGAVSSGPIDGTGQAACQALALDANGTAVVAWHDSNADRDAIYVKRFDGSAWVELGVASAAGTGIGESSPLAKPTLAIDSRNHPVVAWHAPSSGNTEIFAKQFDGFAWVELGAGSASGGGISHTQGASTFPTLAAAPTGDLMIAWEEQSAGNTEIYVRRFDGAQWVELGSGSATGAGISNSTGASVAPSLAVSNERVCVAWNESGSNSVEVVMRCADR